MQPTGHPAAMPGHSLADPSKGGRDKPDHLVAFSWNRWSPSPGTAGRHRWNAHFRRTADLSTCHGEASTGSSWSLSGFRGSPLQRSAEIPCPGLLEQAIGRQSVPALPGAADCLGARWAGDQTVRHIAIEIGDLDLSSFRHKHPESRRGTSRLARREHASVHQRGRQPAPDHGGWRIALRRTCSSYPSNSGAAPSFLPVRNAVLTLPIPLRLIRPRASRW